jgi:ribosome maturation factor RimP
MYRETIRQSIVEIVEPLLQTQGFELVELQLQQRKGQWLIRVFADAEGGISLEDCRRLSRDIGQAFDLEDLIARSG